MRQPPARSNVVLNPPGTQRVGAVRAAPSADLSPLVEACWTSFWRLPPGAVHHVEILTDACAHVVFEPGASNVVGVVTHKFTRELTGSGRVVGLKLKAGALRAVTAESAANFNDRRRPLPVAPGLDLRAAERAIFAATNDAQRFLLAESFLRAQLERTRAARWLPQLERIQAILSRIECDFQTLRVEELARDFELSPRSLTRLFKEHVGVGPKWVIQRERLLRAAERIQSGRAGSLAELAASLGYFDQAHFAREFSAIVGRPPATHARSLAQSNPPHSRSRRAKKRS